MSLIICPDCGHEVSTAAIACANCGRPLADPTIERNVVITEVPPPVRDEFPKWIFIPLGVLGLLVLLVLFVFMRNNDDTANTNVNINVAGRRSTNDAPRDATTVRTEPQSPNQINTVPPAGTTTVTVPQTQSTTVTSVPSQNVNPDKGTVSMEVKFRTQKTGLQVVKNTKFYLLKKDLDEILDKAGIEDATGQGLRNAFGMSFLFRSRDPETYPKAMQEIGKNVAYSVMTDAAGKAQLKDIKPDDYYLFGITKAGNGFAIWSAPVVIRAGENPLLDLSQPIVTEVQQ